MGAGIFALLPPEAVKTFVEQQREEVVLEWVRCLRRERPRR